MKHAMSAVVALALGFGLAAAAQAQGTTPANPNLDQNTQAAAPATTMQPNAPAAGMQANEPAQNMQSMQKQHARPMRSSQRTSRKQIMQEQRQLRAEGLYKGRIDGIAGPKTRQAVAKLKSERGVSRTATLKQHNKVAHRMGSRTTGVGSSVPNKRTQPMQPPASQIPSGAGDNNMTNQNLNQNPNQTR